MNAVRREGVGWFTGLCITAEVPTFARTLPSLSGLHLFETSGGRSGGREEDDEMNYNGLRLWYLVFRVHLFAAAGGQFDEWEEEVVHYSIISHSRANPPISIQSECFRHCKRQGLRRTKR